DATAVNPDGEGTKGAFHYRLEIPAGGEVVLGLRLAEERALSSEPFSDAFDHVFDWRITEADQFFAPHMPRTAGIEHQRVLRQAFAGLLWSRQFYHYAVAEWLDGDPAMPPPPPSHRTARNADWRHLYNRDVLSMPDTWEYPWYAAWDLAFHTVPLGDVDGAS